MLASSFIIERSPGRLDDFYAKGASACVAPDSAAAVPDNAVGITDGEPSQPTAALFLRPKIRWSWIYCHARAIALTTAAARWCRLAECTFHAFLL